MTTTHLGKVKNCFCGNDLTFRQCCQPIIDGNAGPINAEMLMRSRFTAYVIEDYQYILQTYTSSQRVKLTVNELFNSAQGTHWLSLQVLAHHAQKNTAQVEFKVIYRIHNCFYLMHELSDFIFSKGKWLYSHGVIQRGSGEVTPERNSQCVCNSGKKFKKCCGK